jgi:hypothetical protein
LGSVRKLEKIERADRLDRCAIPRITKRLGTELETNPKYFPSELKAIAFQVIQDLLNLQEGED